MREALRVHAGTLVGRRVRIVQGSPLVAPSFRFLSGEAGTAMGYDEASGELAISLDNPKFGRLNLHALAAHALAVPAAGTTAAGATAADVDSLAEAKSTARARGGATAAVAGEAIEAAAGQAAAGEARAASAGCFAQAEARDAQRISCGRPFW